MMTINKLKSLQKEYRNQINIRIESGSKITIGMGECGIAAGSRDVMLALLDAINDNSLHNVHIFQDGYFTDSEKAVAVKVEIPGEQAVEYIHVKPENAAQIIQEHIIKGNVVTALVNT